MVVIMALPKSVKQWAIVPAAGIGARMNDSTPKQYLSILNKTIIEHTLSVLLTYESIDAIVVAIAADDAYWSSLAISKNPKINKVLGGETRAHSVFNALELIPKQDDPWVLVHDAVRPCLSHPELDLLFSAKSYAQGAVLALPSKNTLKQCVNGQTISKTLNRDHIWQALTPQLFKAQALYQAIENCLKNNLTITDEASAMEQMGHQPYLVLGKASNIKITTSEDLSYAEFLLTNDNITV